MIEINDKSKCSGCHACYNICPKNAILMLEDEKGFKYPQIDKSKCINCGLCDRICPIINQKEINNTPKAFAAINKDEKVRKNSSSGGIFYLLAKYILTNSGVVFGAAFSNDYKSVSHIMINNIKDIDKLMTSKYLQSNIEHTYKECKKFLDDGIKVLFTGTPCQIEGLLFYLKKDYDNLYTQDIICHGVPSPKIWEMYINNLNKKFNQKPIQANFRQKNSGWNSFELFVSYPNSKYECTHNNDEYMKAFLSNYSLRDSCYACHFKKSHRLSDITLGDFWGIDKIDGFFDDNRGTSLLIVNSVKGETLLSAIKNDCIIKEVNFVEAINYNSAYLKSVTKPFDRDSFMNEINEENFNKVVIKYTNKPLHKKILNKAKSIITRAIKK